MDLGVLRNLCRIGQLNGPVFGFLARIDFEEPRAIKAAHEAIFPADDTEFTVTGAHKGLALPFAAVLVHRIDVIELRRQRPAHQSLATACF